MLIYPKWYDPQRDALCAMEDAMEALAAQTRAWRADHAGWTASQMSLWKRGSLQAFFGGQKPMKFSDIAPTDGTRHMVWASKAMPEDDAAIRVEDGFLRSRGLGAELVAPLSLVCDDLGIYYDPSRPSRLEEMIKSRAEMRPDQIDRARNLIALLRKTRVNKYNLQAASADLSDYDGRPRILVPGQVEDDASVLTGTDTVRTNLALLQSARDAYPEAEIFYKPHPDVEAGLRKGAIDASGLADLVLEDTDPMAVLGQVDIVWTMTSLLGFEALVRGVQVVTFGAPFYAGWGLTDDRGDVPPRRRAELTLEGLVHAALIDYPRYFDPKTAQPCAVEVAVERLATGDIPTRGPGNRMLSKLQGVFASQAHIWRRK